MKDTDEQLFHATIDSLTPKTEDINNSEGKVESAKLAKHSRNGCKIALQLVVMKIPKNTETMPLCQYKMQQNTLKVDSTVHRFMCIPQQLFAHLLCLC